MANLPIVFANAIPKSGSTLLFNIVRGLVHVGPFVDPGLPVIKPYTTAGEPTPPSWILKQLDLLRPGDVRCGYLYATPDNMRALLRPKWANFFILRDPRDQIVSEIYYALEIHLGHALHGYLHSLPTMEHRIAVMINGIPEGELRRVDVNGHYARFLPWIAAAPQVCVIRFEELVSNPASTLGGILDYLEGFGFVPVADRAQSLERLKAQMDPARSNTYRKGSAGTWQQHFSQANKRLFKEVTGDLLVRLGYERDMRW